jgi:hypothetical protein
MTSGSKASPRLVARLIREALETGASIQIDGLGTFRPDGESGFVFDSERRPTVFIAYVHENADIADRLFDAFLNAGFDPWLDRRKLLPGQNWPRAIQDALETSDFVVPCFSAYSVRKKGGFQAEIRYALDCASRIPLDHIFLVPVRLDNCPIPAQISRVVQYVDLFPDFQTGFRRILRVLKRQPHVKLAA